jgi:hypothetical protein
MHLNLGISHGKKSLFKFSLGKIDIVAILRKGRAAAHHALGARALGCALTGTYDYQCH